MTRILFFLVFYSTFYSLAAQNTHPQEVITPQVNPELRFTENNGQWPGHILFKSRLNGGSFYIERNCLTFNFYDKKKFRELHNSVNTGKRDLSIKGHAYKVRFVGCNTSPAVEKAQEGSDYENFFIGKDESKWKSDVRNYHQVWLRDLYPGIDYEIITAANGLKYNFHLKPGADPSLLQLQYDGVEEPKIKNGALVLSLSVNEVVEQKPFAYQLVNGILKQVPCRYKLQGKILSFEFPEGYNRSFPLVIDPVLVFAAQSGSSADNFGMTATFDAQGNLYAGGTVYDNGYPTTTGAYMTSFQNAVQYGHTDVVVTKYNSSGTNLLFSTYLGGIYAETVHSMIVDQNNNLCIYGVTGSSDFPVTSTAYDKTFNGGVFIMFVSNGMRFDVGTDIYITKFNSAGTNLLGSTFLGGTANDGLNHSDSYVFSGSWPATPPQTGLISVYEPVYDSLQSNYGDQCRGEIQVDANNNIYIASSTRSSDFPTLNGFDNSLGGTQDGVVAKFNSSLSSLLHSSFIGGSATDAGYGLIVKSNLDIYITGGTTSQNFPYTSGGYQSAFQGGTADGYVLRVSPTGSTVLNGTFFGTSLYDQSFFVQSDKYDNIYIYGQSLGNIPVLKAANATSVFSVAATHQFISRFNKTLATLNLSTVFGSNTTEMDISPSAFSVDKCNNIYISGWGGNILNSFPVLSNMPLKQATQSITDGFDFYFMGLDSNAALLKYGSYFGGSSSREHVDGGTSRFDPQGRIYQSACAGCGGNDDFPVTSGAWPGTPGNSNHSSNCNNGVIKLDFQLQLAIATIKTNTLQGCVPMVVTFTNATAPTGSNSSYVWYFGNGSTNSSSLTPTVTFTNPGTYTVALVVVDPATCNVKDSSVTYVTVHNPPTTTISVQSTQCQNTVQVSHVSTGTLGTNPFAWNFGNGSSIVTQGTATYTYPTNGNYNITFTLTDINGCRDVETVPVTIFTMTASAITNTNVLCIGSTATLTGFGGTSYSWSPGTSLSSTNSASAVASPVANTIYTVIIANNSAGFVCSRTLTLQVGVLPNPSAAFVVTSTPCSNTISIVNSSAGDFTTNPYSWNFGDGTGDKISSAPNYTYSADGIYNVVLTAKDVNGCMATASKTVAILNFEPGVVGSGTICNGNSVQLTALGGTNYTWTPGTYLSNAQVAAPLATPPVNSVYSVTILNTTYGFNCSKTLTAEVYVNPTPTANFIYTMNPCGGGVTFFDKSEEDIVSWSWRLESKITSTLQSPYHFYKTGGTHTVVLTTTNEYGCIDKEEKQLVVAIPPPVGIGSSTSICVGSTTRLMAVGGVAYHWEPAGSLDSPATQMPYATPSITTEYSVVITTSATSNGIPCEFMLTTKIGVDQLSVIKQRAFADPVVVNIGEPTTLTYVGDPGATVTWLPFNTTTPQTGYVVQAYPTKPTTYTATVNDGACKLPLEVHVDAVTPGCTAEDVFVPNTFTPNGDGENDLFRVKGIKVSEMYLAVYNRWGERVYETTDKAGGWDGRYQGKDADVGVFGYYLTVKCSNGGETLKKGNVTLIR